MITQLLLTLFFAVFVSGLTSLVEAAIYAVPAAYVNSRAQQGLRSALRLKKLKDNLSKPIAAIVILNTLTNVFGASYLGYVAGQYLGGTSLVFFTIAYTVAILYLTEILPKSFGVMYCRGVSEFAALPLTILVYIEWPLIVISESITRFLNRRGVVIKSSPQEIISMTDMGREDGVLDHLEGSVIRNIIGLDEVLVKDVLTPRVVVFRLDVSKSVEDVSQEILNCHFSRIPVFNSSEPDTLIGYVTLRDLYRQFIDGDIKQALTSFVRPLKTVPELMRVDLLVQQMFSEREQICAAIDEHGGLAGIITLEDIVEEIVGREIVDEYDTVSDLRTYARISRFTSMKKRNVWKG